MRVRVFVILILSLYALDANGKTVDSVSQYKPTKDTIINVKGLSSKIDSFGRMDISETPKNYVVRSIKTEGNKYLGEQTLINTSGLQVGDTIVLPGEHLTMAARRLWDQRFFSDVKVATEFEADKIDVTILLKERPRVSNWYFEGVKQNQKKELVEDKLRLRRGSELSDYVINNSIRLIKDYFKEKAFRKATVDYKIEPDSTFKGAVNVTFVIKPGVKQRIGEIKIEGAKELNPKKIARSMKNTKAISINFFNDTKFKDKDFPTDKQSVIDYMKSKGFRDAEIITDSIYDINDKRMGVYLKINEGKKYYYRDITWLGNSVYPTSYLADLVLGVKKGDTYDSETMSSRLGIDMKGKPGALSVDGMYKDNGYLAFVVKPFETVVGDSVDVEVRMVEGKQFRIRNVTFEGNTRTNDHVIRRELETVPGDLYSQSLLMRTYQRLATMGQFDAQTLMPNVLPNMQTELVDIGYSLTEVSKDQFELSVGWGGGMFIASVAVKFTNISLRKFFDKKAWRPYPAGDNQTIGISVQSNGTYYQAASLNFMEPWLGGKKPTSLSVSVYWSSETNAYNWSISPSKFFTTIGGSIGIGKRLRWPDPFFTLSIGATVQSYKMTDWDYFFLRNGIANTIALNLAFGRNSVDDPMQYPTSGSDISLKLAITPPYSAFDGIDYSNPNLSNDDRYRWIEYHKWRLNAQWFFPLTADRKLVLMARAQYGYLGSYNKDKPSPFEGFNMGGDGLTSGYNIYGVETVGLRGYENGSLTPYQGMYAQIFSKYTAELRYPIVKQPSTLVYALIFAEAGNAFMTLKEFKPFQLKKAAGVGLRIFLPMLGMLGIDWGYGFDPATDKSTPSGSQFHFTMGMQM